MKKASLFLALLLMPLLCLVSCGDDTAEPNNPESNPQKVQVSVSYTFAESGEMTRSVGSDAYDKFYDAQIETKTLTPKHYSLTFTEKETGAKYEYKGQWGDGSKISILEGDYTVTGTSAPVTETVDTLSMSFNSNIQITQDTKEVTLQADNDCFLLLLNANSIASIKYGYNKSSYAHDWRYMDLNQSQGVFYMFINRYYSAFATEDVLNLKYQTGSSESINLNPIRFEKGKYYYFNEITHSFDIPPMQQGN